MDLDEPSVLLMEMKVGLLLPKDGKLVPDQRRGLMRLVQEGPMMLKLMWCERDGDNVVAEPEATFVIMPQMNAIEFKQIGNPKSRCYALKIDGTDIKFFWLQEPDAGGDEMRIERLRETLGGVEISADMDEIMAADDGESGMGITGPTEGTIAHGGGVGASQLAAILGNIMGGGGGNGGSDAAGALQQIMMRGMAKNPGPSLAEILTPEVLLPLLQGPETLERLQEHLPEAHRNFQGLMGVANSPQFQQQVETFSHALQTGQLDMAQFGLDAKGFSVADFLASIEAAVKKEQDEKKEAEKPGDSDNMQN